MKQRHFQRWLLSLFILLSLAVLPACKGEKKDGDIQTAFNSKAQSDPNLAGVAATVVNGTVTLTGNCADENCRKAAEKTVKEIDGVKNIVNNIQVGRVQVADDSTIRSAAEGVVSKYDGVQAAVSDGVITLRGTIDDREKLQQLMMELNAVHPQRIENQLVLKNN